MGVLLIMILSMAFATSESQPMLCENLHELTSTPGLYPDGTGQGRTRSATEPTAASELAQKARKLAEPVFLSELKTNEAFRQKVIKASGQEQCDFAKPECQKYFAEVASYFYSHRHIDPQVTNIKGSLEDKLALIQDSSFISLEAKVTESLQTQEGYSVSDEKIRTEMLPRVKKLMLDKLDQWDLDPEVKKKLKKRLSEVEYGGSKCNLDQVGSPLAGLLQSNAFYEPNSKKIYICGAFTYDNNSEFFLVSSLAHELAHSIDPCAVSQPLPVPILNYPLKITPDQAADHYPVKGVLSCLKSKDTIGAQRLSLSDVSPAFAGKVPESGETRAAAKKIELFDSFCHEDQINESFSDWFATETLPEYIDTYHPSLTQRQLQLGYSNAFRYHTQKSQKADFHHHPRREDRVNKLLLAHPKVRQHMGCPTESQHYCAPPSQSKEAIKASKKETIQ